MSKSNKESKRLSMRWQIASIIVLLICVVIIISKLTGGSTNSKDVNTITSKKPNLKPTNELLLEIPGTKNFPKYYYDAIGEFKAQYPNVKVTVKRVGEANDYPPKQYQTALTNELMAGSGPDVIITDYFTSDLYKTMDTGAFLNMSSIIKGDKEFNMKDFNSVIMSAGDYKGGQYIIPLAYTAMVRVADQSGLNKIGFNIDNVTNCTSFLQEMSKSLPKAKGNPSFVGMFDWPMLDQMLESSGIPLVDEKSKTVLGHEDAIRAFCEAYQPLYKLDNNNDSSAYSGSDFDLFSQAIQPFGFTYWDSSWIVYWSLIKSKGDKPVLVVPTAEGGGVHASVTNGVAIRAGSPNQLNAWNFIKILLSTKLQNMLPNKNFGFGYPINNKALEQQLHSYLDGSMHWHINKGDGEAELVDLSVLTTSDIELFKKTIDGIKTCSLKCKPTESLFLKCMEPYFKKENTLDSCIDDLKKQLKLYISE